MSPNPETPDQTTLRNKLNVAPDANPTVVTQAIEGLKERLLTALMAGVETLDSCLRKEEFAFLTNFPANTVLGVTQSRGINWTALTAAAGGEPRADNSAGKGPKSKRKQPQSSFLYSEL